MKQLHISTALVVIALGIPSFACAATDLAPNDFAFGMPLQLQGDAAVYTLTVPKEVYQHTVRADLGDMRVFNSDGEWVTYSLSTPMAKATRSSLVSVPIFPLHGDPTRALDRVKITIASEQGAVNLQTAARDAAPAQIQAYVIDVRKLDQPLTALELRWAEDAAEFSGQVEIESSDDLGTWLPVASNQPIVNLKFDEQHLLQNRLEFPAVKAKYLRLRWQDRPAPFAIREILAEAAPTHTEPSHVYAEITGQPIADQSDTYTFTLDLHAPIDRVNVTLPQTNTIANITLSSRAQVTLPWHDVVTLRVYGLQNNGIVLHNPAAVIAPTSDRFWRMQAHTAGGLGKGTPTLQVAWIPQEITFVARGRGPFQLAFGNAGTAGATSPLHSLLSDPNTPISVGTAAVGAPHELGGATRLQLKRELPWKTWALWAALIGAVAVLGTVAYRLSRELSK